MRMRSDRKVDQLLLDVEALADARGVPVSDAALVLLCSYWAHREHVQDESDLRHLLRGLGLR